LDINLKAIGTISSPRVVAEDDLWGKLEATINLDQNVFTAEALEGLDTFSHAEIVFHMHQVKPEKIELSARHPRNNSAWPKVGIFAQRGKNRPNQIAVTVCEIIGVDGLKLKVRGLDAIDGSPVLDIKPYLAEFAPRGQTRQPEWATELMKHYFF
jgi:tRNA-Thr(GGU) m(6)t(6)A37 methyltransferase TsaA